MVIRIATYDLSNKKGLQRDAINRLETGKSSLLNVGVDEVRRGSRPVAVGLGGDDVVSRGAKVGELTVLLGSSTGEAVLVEASKVLARDVEIKVALIEDPNLELTVRVGADRPVDNSVDVGGDGVAAKN